MDDGILSLKWNNHNSTFIQALSNLHKIDIYSDVTLACEGKYFSVHKVILSICSEYFQEILSKTKCQHPIIILKDIRHVDLEALLNYMYAGEANVSQKELSSLIKAAECLKIKGLATPDGSSLPAESSPPIRERKRYMDRDPNSHSLKKRRSDDSFKTIRNLDYDKSSKVTTRSERTRQQQDDGGNDEIMNDDGVIPEILLEDESLDVKQERNELKMENVEQNLKKDIDISYTSISIDESANGDFQLSHSLSDIISQPDPSTSGIQGETSWESNSSGVTVTGYSEGFSQEESRGQVGYEDNFGFYASDPAESYTGNNKTLAGRVWSCYYSECTYVADRESALRKHIRKHTGEKPFACPFCPHMSSQKSNLTAHVRIKHSIVYGKDS